MDNDLDTLATALYVTTDDYLKQHPEHTPWRPRTGFAEYGYCASHSRYFWGLRLHLLATLDGLPVGFAHRSESRRT